MNDEDHDTSTSAGHDQSVGGDLEEAGGSSSYQDDLSPGDPRIYGGAVDFNDDDSLLGRKKGLRDPMSHRIIEKRRRDRMNNCLADLSRLIPSSYLKKGRGRVEKTEIIEMAIKHMKHLQSHSNCRSLEKCDLLSSKEGKESTAEPAASAASTAASQDSQAVMERNVESFKMGYRECLSELAHCLVEREGLKSSEAFCVRIIGHLQRHFDRISKVKILQATSSKGAGKDNFGRALPASVTSDYGGSNSSANTVTNSSGSNSGDDKTELKRKLPPSGNPDLEASEEPENLTTHTLFHRTGEMLDDREARSEMYKFKANLSERFIHQRRGSSPNPASTLTRLSETAKQSESADWSGNPGASFKRRRTTSASHPVSEYVDEASTSSDPHHQAVSGGHVGGSSSSSSSLFQFAALASHQTRLGEDAAGVRGRCSDPQRRCSSPAVMIGTQSQRGQRTLEDSNRVPIFALHPKGTFYIPLSVATSVISPYLYMFSSSKDSSVLLHPITINVNFCTPVMTDLAWPQVPTGSEAGEGGGGGEPGGRDRRRRPMTVVKSEEAHGSQA